MRRSHLPRRKKPLPRSTAPIPRSSKPRARKADPKTRRWAKHRDPDYEKWIESLPCLICQRNPVDPAHIKKRSTGGDDRSNLLPLCRTHHDEQEDHTEEFEARYSIELRYVAILLTAQYEAEHPEAAA